MASGEKSFVLGFLRRMFMEAMGSSLGESVGEAIVFALRSRLGQDPFEVFGKGQRQFTMSWRRYLAMEQEFL